MIRAWPFEPEFDFFYGHAQQRRSLGHRDQVLSKCAIAEAAEPPRHLVLPDLILPLQRVRLPRPPTPCDRLPSINKRGLGDHIQVPQTHQERCTAHTIEALEVDDLVVTERIPVLAYLAEQVLRRHQERTGEQVRGFLFVPVIEAVRVDQAVRQFMGQRQPPSL